jgi:hypothetical protein
MRLNPPVIVIRATKADCVLLLLYCQQCNTTAFTGPYNFTRLQPAREAFLQYHLNAVTEQLLNKLYQFSHENDSKLIKVKLNHAERLAFSLLFQRVDVPAALTPLERDILNQLTYKTY